MYATASFVELHPPCCSFSYTVICGLLGLNGFSCCWKVQRKKDTRRGECAFKLVKGSMKSFELNKGNILPEKTKKKSRSLWPLSVLAVFTDILLHA